MLLWMDLCVCKICCSICWVSKLDEFWFTRVCTILFSTCVNSSVEPYNTDLDASTFFSAFSKMWRDFSCSFCWSGIWILACLNFLSKLTFSFIHTSNWRFNSPNMDSFEEMTGFTVSNSATSDQCKVFEKLGFDITFPLTFLCIGPQNLQGLSTFLTFNESRDELLHSNTEDKTSSDVFDSNVEGALLVNASSKCIFFASFAAFFILTCYLCVLADVLCSTQFTLKPLYSATKPRANLNNNCLFVTSS